MNQRYLKQNNIESELQFNNRIYSRNLPSFKIEPQFDLRPTSTKYSHMQIVDEKPKPTESIDIISDYNTNLVFFPGNRRPPFSFFSKNIDVESKLRSQFFALQKNDLTEYVPSSNSSLYNNNYLINSNNINSPEQTQLFTQLNQPPQYTQQSRDMNTLHLSPNMFYNTTRMNIKEDTRIKK